MSSSEAMLDLGSEKKKSRHESKNPILIKGDAYLLIYRLVHANSSELSLTVTFRCIHVFG